MDPAMEIEVRGLSRQKAMIEAIERGDSQVQAFYAGATLLVTGFSGFLGKQLVEKLLRSCPKVKKVFLLLRGKRGVDIQTRLQTILEDPVFEVLRKKEPTFDLKLVPVAGDTSERGLGLSERDRKTITEEVNVIIHAAATTRFDETLKIATNTNLRGTRELIFLAKECQNLQALVYVSTAYSGGTEDLKGSEVFEKFYGSPVQPAALIDLVNSIDEDVLNDITPKLIKGWPNTYTFTKRVAEEMVRSLSGGLPVCLIRPTIVIGDECAYYSISKNDLRLKARALTPLNMSLLLLPPEILRIIIGKLDTQSIHNLYEAGVAPAQGLPTECQFSMNTLATARSLRLNFFRGISGYLKVLNLSGVSDLDAPTLVDALTTLNNLTDLDVTYTNIMMPDFLQIVKARPTLKSIGINFVFDHDGIITISGELLLEYQQAFEGFQNVHLVCGWRKSFRMRLAELMLQKVHLLSLKIVFHDSEEFYSTELVDYENFISNNIKMISVSEYQLNFLKETHFEEDACLEITMDMMPVVRLMDLNKYEIVIVCEYLSFTKPDYKVYATPSLSDYLSKKFSIPVITVDLNFNRNMEARPRGNIFMFWDRERVQFDDEFYSKLDSFVREYFIWYIPCIPCLGDPAPADFKWTNHVRNVEETVEVEKVFDYATLFKDREHVYLYVQLHKDLRNDANPVILSLDDNTDFLRNLNHLCLDTDVNLHPDLFKNLFKFANSLVTFQLNSDFEKYVEPECFQFMKESKSLRNIFIAGFMRDLDISYLCLSECRALQNICLDCNGRDLKRRVTFATNCYDSLPCPRHLFSKCDNLYHFYLDVPMSNNVSDDKFKQMVRVYETVRCDLRKHALNLQIKRFLRAVKGALDYKSSYVEFHHSPYFRVFDIKAG